MAPMKDALNLVLDGTAGELNEQQKKFLVILNRNMERLIRMVNDLLDLSKIEAGNLQLRKEYISITYLLDEIVDSLRVYAGKKKIELSLESKEQLPEISCDKDRITQVIINLVMNGINFTPEGGKVTVVTKARQGKSVIVSVKDTGPGITPDEADALFNRFKQLTGSDKVKGTGLGLAISKAIIEMHEGRIWVESEAGKGSTFNFALPV
jgi:signal transduction histidine kinase